MAAEPEIIHSVACFHAKYGANVHGQTYCDLEEELRERIEAIEPALWSKTLDWTTLNNNGWTAEQDLSVDELCRHFPGLAPAIRAVAYHLGEQAVDERGVCCQG